MSYSWAAPPGRGAGKLHLKGESPVRSMRWGIGSVTGTTNAGENNGGNIVIDTREDAHHILSAYCILCIQ